MSYLLRFQTVMFPRLLSAENVNFDVVINSSVLFIY